MGLFKGAEALYDDYHAQKTPMKLAQRKWGLREGAYTDDITQVPIGVLDDQVLGPQY
jgi:hypothetical protein